MQLLACHRSVHPIVTYKCLVILFSTSSQIPPSCLYYFFSVQLPSSSLMWSLIDKRYPPPFPVPLLLHLLRLSTSMAFNMPSGQRIAMVTRRATHTTALASYNIHTHIHTYIYIPAFILSPLLVNLTFYLSILYPLEAQGAVAFRARLSQVSPVSAIVLLAFVSTPFLFSLFLYIALCGSSNGVVVSHYCFFNGVFWA